MNDSYLSLDRKRGSESLGRRFESFQAHQLHKIPIVITLGPRVFLGWPRDSRISLQVKIPWCILWGCPAHTARLTGRGIFHGRPRDSFAEKSGALSLPSNGFAAYYSSDSSSFSVRYNTGSPDCSKCSIFDEDLLICTEI